MGPIPTLTNTDTLATIMRVRVAIRRHQPGKCEAMVGRHKPLERNRADDASFRTSLVKLDMFAKDEALTHAE